MKRFIKLTAFVILLIFSVSLVVYFPKLHRVYKAMHFFDPDLIFYNFTNANTFSTSTEIEKASKPYHFLKKEDTSLPKSFSFRGQEFNLLHYLDSSQTTGFLILQNDSLLFEKYYLGNSDSTRHLSWSVAKSYVSALMGIAISDGYIKNINQKVEEYLPELIGSGYEGVSIKNVLQMSTGVAFNEDYDDFHSDINRWGRWFAWGASQDEFAATLENEKPPGTYNHYVSINTHVLGMLIVKATGKTLSEYLQEEIWKKIGAEYNAYWLTDDYGMEMALGGLNITLRDYAKIGRLFLHEGNWNGQQIVPVEWVQSSTTPSAPHVMPGSNPNSAHSPWGYGYQWWIPEGNEGEFMARGVYNQYIYVNPTTQTVIVKNSANYNYNDKSNPFASIEAHVELFREIAHAGVH